MGVETSHTVRVDSVAAADFEDAALRVAFAELETDDSGTDTETDDDTAETADDSAASRCTFAGVLASEKLRIPCHPTRATAPVNKAPAKRLPHRFFHIVFFFIGTIRSQICSEQNYCSTFFQILQVLFFTIPEFF